jgi:hypothetical protein
VGIVTLSEMASGGHPYGVVMDPCGVVMGSAEDPYTMP